MNTPINLNDFEQMLVERIYNRLEDYNSRTGYAGFKYFYADCVKEIVEEYGPACYFSPEILARHLHYTNVTKTLEGSTFLPLTKNTPCI